MKTKLDDPTLIDVTAILARIQRALNIASDAELAKLFGVKPVTVAAWKSRNSMPLELVVQLAVVEGLNLEEIVLGTKGWIIPQLTYLDTIDRDENGVSVIGTEDCDIRNAGLFPAGYSYQFAIESDPAGTAKKHRVILVTSDEMSPELVPGDLALVYPYGRIEYAGIYAFTLGNITDFIFARAQLMPGNKVKLSFDDDESRERIIDQSTLMFGSGSPIPNLIVFGLVKGVLRNYLQPRSF
ncbi:MAG: helix-turn-helix domain-containing protein [Syntrophorhabdaceae bacterium]|nr:helix-turn-helix domain-containing protein [Syntrophorhabdaceae bacterium]